MNVTQLEERVQSHVDAGQILGLALAIVRGNEITYARGFGTTSVEPEGVAVTPTTVFDIASISKVILGTLIMRLVERGTLDLDEPVLTYLPGFAFSDAERGRRVTLRHLLSHTAGLPAAGKDWGPPGRDALGRFVREQLSRHAFLAEPGRVHLYSNTAICLAGHVAEAAAGRHYRELVRDEVLVPLAMARTTYERAVALTYRAALPHEVGDDGRPRTLHRWTDNASGEPSGFAIAPVLDLANLALMHLNGGRFRDAQYLAPATVATMHTPHADRHVAGASHPLTHLWSGHGLGVMTGRYRGARVVQHGGMSQSFNNFFHLLPDAGAGFVVLTNYGDDRRIVDLVFAIYDALLDFPGEDAAARTVPLPAALAARDREDWTSSEGTYLNIQQGRLVTVASGPEGRELGRDARVHRLVPLGAGAYYYEDPAAGGRRVPVAFLSEGGRPSEDLVIGGDPYHRLVPDPEDVPDPASWTRFVGAYRDPSNLGVGAVWRIEIDERGLRLIGDWVDERCIPLGPATFLSSIGLLEFDALSRTLTVGKATRYHQTGSPP